MEFYMNKTVLFFGVAVALIVAWLIGFVESLNEEVDVSYGVNEKKMVMTQGYNSSYDNFGNELLTLSSELSTKEKMAQWNSSGLKQEMLQEFPKFGYMKEFVKLHISDVDVEFKEKLLEHIDAIEMYFVSAKMNGDQAKAAL